MITFSQWLADQIWQQYGKSQYQWTDADTDAQINKLSNVALLEYFAIYQHKQESNS